MLHLFFVSLAHRGVNGSLWACSLGIAFLMEHAISTGTAISYENFAATWKGHHSGREVLKPFSRKGRNEDV